MTSPLPAGVRLWIWPRYVIEVDGTKIPLGRVQGRMLALLIMTPNKLWTVQEIIAALYEDRDDGGPLYARKLVYWSTKRLIDKFAEHGIVLKLEIVGETRRFLRVHATSGMPVPAPAPSPLLHHRFSRSIPAPAMQPPA